MIPLNENRLFRCRMWLTHIEVYGERANDDLSLMSNTIELRLANSDQFLRFKGSVVFNESSGRRMILFKCEDVNLFLTYLYTQKDRLELEYRTLNIRPVSDISYTEIWYPTKMLSNVENIAYQDVPGSGVYTVTASTTSLPGGEYRAFNRNITDAFASAQTYSPGGSYQGTVTTDSVLGEWIQIEFPCTLNVGKFFYYASTGGVRDGTLFGYNDAGSIATEVWSGTIPSTTNTWFNFPLIVPGNYRRLRFIARSTYAQQRMRVFELAFVGAYDTQEPDEVQFMFNLSS